MDDIKITGTEATPTPTTYTVTYNANGGTGTMTDSNSPYNAGATVTVLDNEFTRDGYTFDHWNTADDNSGTNYDEGDEFTINANTTLYAQWTENGGSGSTPVVDVLDRELTGVTNGSSSYSNWSGKTSNSNAVYAGNSAGSNNSIQLRSTNNSGIITTATGGIATKIEVDWYSSTISGRVLNVYGKNTAYSAASDLYDSNNQGTLLGTIVKGTSTELTIDGDYAYIGLRSNDGAMYLNSVSITWEATPSVATPLMNPKGGTYGTAQNITISCATEGAQIRYTTDGSDPTETSTLYTTPLNISSNTTIKTIAYKNNDASRMVTAAYTFLAPLTTMQQVFNAATSTSTQVAITFDNFVITGKSSGNNSNKAFLTDGTKGCIIYESSHGFTAGDVLNGTAVCNLVLSGNAAQLTGLTRSTYGLTVTTGEEVTPIVATVNTLTAVNTGYVVTLNGLRYDGTTALKDSNDNTVYLSNTIYTASLTSGKTYNITGVFEVNYSSKRINPRSLADVQEVVSADPTINTSVSSVTGFTYVVDNGPSAAQTVSVSGINLEGNITLALNDGENSDFEISLFENSDYTHTLSLSPTDGSVSATTVYVRLKTGMAIANNYEDEINLASTNATQVSVSLAGTVTPPAVTWDLTTNSYSSASATEVDWTSGYVNMTLTKGSSSTGANNALGGSTYNHTRFYQNQNLTFTPQSGYAISSIVITAVSGYVAGFTGNTWTNATAETSGTTVTITPTNGNNACSVVISGACRATAVTVYYTASTATSHAINLDDDMENGTVVASHTEAIAGTTVTLYIYPAAGYYLEDDDDIEVRGTSAVTLTKVNAGTYSFVMPDEDVTVYAIYSAYSGTYYTLVNSTDDLIPGRHYIIASSKTAGPAKVMGGQDGNFRSAIDTDVIGNTIYATTNVREVVISGDATNYWTLYDDANALTGIGYLYAGNSILRGRTDNSANNNHLWSISISAGEATIMSQIEGDDVTNTIKYNPQQPRFTTYKPSSGMSSVYLFMSSNTDCDFYGNTTISGNVTLSEANAITVTDGVVVTFTGTLTNTNPAHLVIKDGGQLKFYGTGAKDGEVQATLEKNIEKYTTDNNGWNFIASPLTSAFAPDATMTSNTYDLYRLNNTKWENYKEHEGNAAAGFSLANGRGYLYANSTDVTLSFAGAIKPFNNENPSANRVSVNAGWNLIGNPYTFDVYVNQPYYSIIQAQDGITANTTVASKATAIKPCTGILVYAKSDDYVVEFLENEPDASTGNHGNIQMTLAHNVATRDGNRVEAIDNAIVSFNEDAHLEKFYFGEPEANIYIPQNGRDYAIAFSNRQGDVPLNFKTNKISTYTISFEGEEMNLNGVYLIDMLEEEEIDLGTTPSYTFLGSPSDKAARFKIVFRNTGDDADSDIFAYQNGTDIIVSGEGELQIFDVMGRKVSSQRINGVETINVKSQGVYIMKLNEKTQKIVVR